MTITVLTGTLPERHRLFAECAVTVARQTVPPAAWLVEWDHLKLGPVEVFNELARVVNTEWLFPLADDDLLEYDHFETLTPYLTGDFDIVYSWCRVEGGTYPEQYQKPFDAGLLTRDNYIPASACIRTELWRELGGYQKSPFRWEDWDFWVRALDVGARFRCVPVVTWTYRMGPWERVSA